MMTRNVSLHGATASPTSRSASGGGSVRSDSDRSTTAAMSSERGRIREREIRGLVGTEPVGREKVSTERRSEKVSTERGLEKVSTEPPGVLRNPNIGAAPRKYNTNIPHILPHERVFPIQIGSELFRLSGASISSDGMYISLFGGLEIRWMVLTNLEHPHTFPSFFNAN